MHPQKLHHILADLYPSILEFNHKSPSFFLYKVTANVFSNPIRLGVLVILLIGGMSLGSRFFLWRIALNPDIPASLYRPVGIDPQQLNQQWIVNGDQAIRFIQQGATLLDARSWKLLQGETIPGSRQIAWQDFSQSQKPNRGKLLTQDEILTQKLQALGIFQDQPVIVVIDPKTGWGEDGRIVWMLRTLGHNQAVFVDGGYPALISAGFLKLSSLPQSSSKIGDFVVRRRSDWTIDRDQLKMFIGLRPNIFQQQLDSRTVVVIDSREPREYAGQTPYGEQRGGHIPSAIPLYYQDWLDENGLLLPQAQILAQLAQRGIIPETEVVVYCTGGVRSAWLTTVLVDLGYNAKNYAGSMWEWSASPAESYPLER